MRPAELFQGVAAIDKQIQFTTAFQDGSQVHQGIILVKRLSATECYPIVAFTDFHQQDCQKHDAHLHPILRIPGFRIQAVGAIDAATLCPQGYALAGAQIMDRIQDLSKV
jgi:hypothetical protein